MRAVFTILPYGLLYLVFPFYLAGLSEKTKAFMAGRKGRPLLQPWHDFVKLLRKSQVKSNSASALSAWAPLVSLAAVLTAGLLLPLAGHRALPGFPGDIVLFAYLLALARFVMILNALDAGSSFEGMGAAREAVFGLLGEAILFMLLGTLTLFTGGSSFSDWPLIVQKSSALGLPVALSGGFLLFVLLLLEGCRVPFDDPNTHLELTMIHEVMILDNSGPDLAFLNYGGMLKMAIFASLIAGLFGVPAGPWGALGVHFAIVSGVGVLLGLMESVMARIRLQILPQLLLGVSGLAFVLFVTVLLGGN
ncbi:MAG: respiratory chain complex I subunit 1 family protein [Bacteroidota bacterium]